MATDNRKALYRKTLISGALSLISYVLLFVYQDWVVRYFTRGGWYALLPIATAFYFSFVHGTFTSCLLHVMEFRVAPGTETDESDAGDATSSEVRP